MSQLRRSPPVPLSRFLSVLETLQDVAALVVDVFLRPKPCWRRRSVRRALPCRPTRLCIFGGAMPYTAQLCPCLQALLQVFLSERVASDLSVLADRLRSARASGGLSLHACLPLASRRRMLASGLPSPSPNRRQARLLFVFPRRTLADGAPPTPSSPANFARLPRMPDLDSPPNSFCPCPFWPGGFAGAPSAALPAQIPPRTFPGN